MEQFWGTIETCQDNQFSHELLSGIIQEYNEKWRHGALSCTPTEARTMLPHWRSPEIDIHEQIDANLLWGTWDPFENG
jgi:hypothetical protein